MNAEYARRCELWLLCIDCGGTGAIEIDGSDQMCNGCDGFGRVPGPDAPRPDWSKAPSWAMWWTVDGNGVQTWFEDEPRRSTYAWEASDGIRKICLWGNIPIGIDWRTLIERRPEGENVHA